MYLGIDVGTQSVKALIYDAQQQRVADLASAPLKLISRADGSREQEALWWLDALHSCCDQLDADLKASVLAVAVSGQQHGFVPLDAAGAVLAPVKLWCDTATVFECDEITAVMGGPEACIEQVGNPVLSGYTASKILWLRRHRPELYARMATIFLPHDYLNFYLSGERAMEYGDASGTGLLDVRKRCWHRAMLDAIDPQRDLAECLPPLLEAGSTVGGLRSDVALELGLPKGIPVACGGGDNMMAAIGTGNVSEGRLTVSLGTSGTLFSYSDTPVTDTNGQLAGFCDSTGGWLPLVCTMNCTVSTELTRTLFNLTVQDLENCVGQASPGSDGVLTLPFFNGERTPNLPNATASLFGLSAANYTQANIMRSAMESSVYGLRSGLELLRQSGCPVQTVRLTGGGARSALWRQMVADIFQMPVSVQRIDEAAALGAAIQAMWVTRGASREELVALVDDHIDEDLTRCCTPNADAASIYEERYAEYLRYVHVVGALSQ